MGKHIGFVSTRFSGTDGVSLESSKWAEVLRCSGHEIFWFAGETDKSAECTYLVPEAHFQHELNDRINQQALEFVRNNKDRPFFLYLPHITPGSTSAMVKM